MNQLRFYLRSYAKRMIRGPQFDGHDVVIGRHVEFGRNVRFRSSKVRIGDGCILHDHITVNADTFEMGDYGTIYHDCFVPGPGSVRIGHNAWIGNNCILDGMGGLTVGDNFGLGAYGQLWTHAGFGDVMAGNRYDHHAPTTIGRDVWMMPRVLVGSVTVGDQVLVLPGSVVTNDLDTDHTYGGSPAKDMTDKTGPYMQPTTLEFRRTYLTQKIEVFAQEKNIKNIWDKIELTDNNSNSIEKNKILINYGNRTYSKKNTFFEYQLIRYLLPQIKITPA
jgi:acetyltransferase-like isoleucine patch superfamily enzyme